MTDVSPLTSPDKSPSLRPNVKPSNEISDNAPVRHITKLNVVFKNDVDLATKTKQKKKSKRNHVDYHSIQWSSSDSDDNTNPYTYGQDNMKSRSIDSNTTSQARSVREDSAAFRHRQRLLDSAARGSMDVSSLLETVLEFEKKNYQRKVRSEMLILGLL